MRAVYCVFPEDSFMDQDFVQSYNEIMKKLGNPIPKRVDNPAHKQVYLDFLKRKALRESDVLPIIDRNKMTVEMHGALLSAFISAMKSADDVSSMNEQEKKNLAAILSMMRNVIEQTNTNELVSQIAGSIQEDLRRIGDSIPDFFAGVYPTGYINAFRVIEAGLPLVLIATGCFEMIETAVITFISKRNETEQAELLIAALDDFFIKGKMPQPEIANHPSINWGSGIVPSLVNAIEEFVITHEIGHIYLGHTKEKSRYALPLNDGTTLSVIKNDHKQEYQADIWALQRLIARAKELEGDDPSRILRTCSGALMFLNIGLMIEALAESRKKPIRDSHPPAENRLYVAEITLDVLGLEDQGGVASSFKRILREMCVLLEVEERVPPMLSRDLNRVAIEIFGDLGIPYQHAKHVAEFI
jgi:hypothetical protein